MPKYDYKCEACGNEFYKWCSIKDRNEATDCTECGALSERSSIPSPFNYIISGIREERVNTEDRSRNSKTSENKGLGGFRINNGVNATIRNCSVTNGKTGISLKNTSVNIEGMYFHNTDQAIKAENSKVYAKNMYYTKNK